MTSQVARRAVLRALAGLRGGALELVEGARTFRFGDRNAELRAAVEIRDPRAYVGALRGSIGLGEAYVDRLWTSPDPVAVVRLACRNLAPFDRLRGRLEPLVGPVQRALSRLPRNTRAGARRHIAAHYDLGNPLFETFLDERLVYSCAYFEPPQATLEDAQLAKLERICERLELGPDDHLVEIGTGWGGLAVHAAATRGCRVTTTTISRQQHSYALDRVRAEGLADRVEVLFRDYRDLHGRYDKLASIEMIEAVGWQYFPAFFERCAALLRRGGRMFLQAIAVADHLYEQEKARRSFATTHVFPSGCLPSQALIAELTRANGLQTEWCEEISSHYVLTLAAWRERFNDAWPRLRGLGYDERFARLWNFYLASSEAGFRERRIRDLQMLFEKPGVPEERAAEWSRTSEPVPASL
jgi:cyclopropane-fatty-acyl-phospholipid synthase